MTTISSKFLSQSQLKSLTKIGDIIIPEHHDFPAFSSTGCINYLDELLEVTHMDDVIGFKWLLTLLRFLPKPLIRILLIILDKHEKAPRFIAKYLRLMNVGLKGIVFNLYYSNLTKPSYTDKKVYEVIDYHVNCGR